ncbi:MAG: T9SS type A sorting domain-containing protein, partial [Candidatus Thorarchaeota archaeon]
NSSAVPTEFDLSQNYPNPFNPATNIQFAVPREAHVTLVIYNVLGQRVTTLVDEIKSTGFHSVEWDGRDHAGKPVASGIYLYRIKTDKFIQSRRMVLLK